jgi:Putative Flp pilus-assembly TadE/G-like
MLRYQTTRSAQRGQMLVLFAVSLTVLCMGVGLVIDGGYGLAQRRATQNAADFAALAGARIVAEKIGGNTVDGTDANVRAAISTTVAANDGAAVTFGSPAGPEYIDASGASVGWVGRGTIPATAVGVTVPTQKRWQPFFLRAVGVGDWTASATATARGGFAAGPPGPVFPAGIAQAFFNGRTPCAGDATADTGSSGVCDPQRFTNGTLNVPGGFGWLKFGCSGYGLGQDSPANAGGCSNSATFLQTEIGPPGDAFGCCTQVGLPGSSDLIGSLPGNKVSADCSYYVDNKTLLTIAVWDYAGGSGSNAYYHIVGFAGFQITACNGGKDLEGVWRQQISVGPTTTNPGFAGQALAVQLVK